MMPYRLTEEKKKKMNSDLNSSIALSQAPVKSLKIDFRTQKNGEGETMHFRSVVKDENIRQLDVKCLKKPTVAQKE